MHKSFKICFTFLRVSFFCLYSKIKSCSLYNTFRFPFVPLSILTDQASAALSFAGRLHRFLKKHYSLSFKLTQIIHFAVTMLVLLFDGISGNLQILLVRVWSVPCINHMNVQDSTTVRPFQVRSLVLLQDRNLLLYCDSLRSLSSCNNSSFCVGSLS